MATAAPVVPSVQPQLCDYCHQKPKFSNHFYCSKTCASQAATLCSHCHKKPKFQNFEFCGKNCAQLAGPSVKTRATAAPSANPSNGQTASGRGNNKNGTGNANQATFDPVQLAKLVAQHIPQVQAMFAGATNLGPAVGQAPPAPIYTNPFATPAPVPQVVQAGQQNNPFLPSAPQQNPAAGAYQTQPVSAGPVPQSNGAAAPLGVANLTSSGVGAQHVVSSTSQQQQQQNSPPAECVIPGCGQPVHVDSKGLKTSEYCSMRHREEAVALGLASPCIMCLIMPQSEMDYFCGRVCREEAMNKGLVHLDDRGE